MVVIFVWVTFNYKKEVRFKIILNKLNYNYWTFGQSDLRTIGPSDYRAFGLSGLRTIGPSPFSHWLPVENQQLIRDQFTELKAHLIKCRSKDLFEVCDTC
jgi:hypothetical protein